MREFKGTKGKWEVSENVVKNQYGTVTFSIDTEDGRIIQLAEVYESITTEEGLCNAKLIATAPELLEALQKANTMICRLKLSMLAHPDCEEDSEFDGYTSSAQELEDEIDLVINKALGL